MNAEKIKNRINEMCTLFGFEYQGKTGNVDPCYSLTEKRNNFLLFFNGKEQTVHDIDAVMSTPFIDGKSLNEVHAEVKVTDW